MPEITQAQFEQLQRSHRLLESLVSDGKKGLDVQRSLAEIDPSLKFPALEAEKTIAAPLQEKLNATEARLQAFLDSQEAERKAASEAKMETTLRDSIGRARAKGKLTEDATNKLVEFMRDKGVADAELALPAFLETLPKAPKPQAGSPYAPQMAGVFGAEGADSTNEDAKLLATKPWAFFDKQVGAVMAESVNEDA